MSKKLYVGNLPFEMTEDELHALFTAQGKVTSTNLIRDKFTGKSRGFGFVEMADDQEASNAIEKIKQTSIGGRNLIVNEARPMKERQPGRSGGFGGGSKRRSW